MFCLKVIKKEITGFLYREKRCRSLFDWEHLCTVLLDDSMKIGHNCVAVFF